MPFYKLICTACGRAFEERASIEARSADAICCPDCGSRKLEPDYSAGSAAVLTKSGGAPARAAETCPHAAQCGCGCARGHSH